MNLDEDAWAAYPQHRLWFNKLHLAERLGYNCGPCGTTPAVVSNYIVRPIYNLGGMGVGTSLKELTPGDFTEVPPGYFWCEYFEGSQYSVTYTYQNGWVPKSCWKGIKSTNDFSKFISWKRDYYYPTLSPIFNELMDVGIINVEFIEDKPIEVHLRESPDPEYNELYPVWLDTPTKTKKTLEDNGYGYIESYDDSNGFLTNPRLGFYVK